MRPDLKGRLADIIVVIGGAHTFHLEAQIAKDDMVILRVFEYGFLHAMSAREEPNRLTFPEPAVVYLDKRNDIPEESLLHISFGGQGCFDYRVKNFVYLNHSMEELNQRKLILLIPFQTMRLRSLLRQRSQSNLGHGAAFDSKNFHQLQDEIRNDIMESINDNLRWGNITVDDASQLLELTNQLYEHIRADFGGKMKGDVEEMKPLLPGALELPNDKYRFRIDELERELARYADEITKYADENAKYADEITKYADENAKYADENEKLKKRIAELESGQFPDS